LVKKSSSRTLLASLLLFGAHAALGETVKEPVDLVDFGSESPSQWRVINDGVMGGLSRSGVALTERGTGLFTGELSLENNGGFASIRTRVGPFDLSESAGIEINVKGDGRTYQLRLRTDDRMDGLTYRVFFKTRTDKWFSVRIPFQDFEPSFRGEVIDDAPPLDPSRIHQIGFLIADKVTGPFTLEIASVRAWKMEATTE
jgi:monofunctional biosynthetic peptidoglycan transglycosylase